ncbi:DNA polymerase-3 subunit epsilon [Neolewinella xylanilytica]|uniref:DNA polymerase-3 subunit epsilon n=1 Tax=Neolewinella xylanilytica TaxID=1514080 RepID=A0A2S6I9T8_9BACT|nr:exonuclease domain-containing protein [Neolewinella xylanilytica]PPK88265.1 DNA polymerase-3 subunit epsilon [Neolewinella xylanilytica]
MSKREYAIVDIETTGGRASRSRITEIGIVVYDGEKVTETFETLLDPEQYIPAGIVELTGITQEMVSGQPKFYEVAKQIVELTEGRIFVAHNAKFDYGFLREEFSRLGYTFSRRKLCTVRLTRKCFPGLKSYSLGNLIQHFGFQVEARHRALADAVATTELLQLCLAGEDCAQEATRLINHGIKETRLPKQIKLEQIMEIPDETGVYYFHDDRGDVIYVGKSTNIRKRIAQHFNDHTTKGSRIAEKVADITYEITGSELVALLLESEEIKRLQPRINRAQRGKRFSHAIHSYLNERGFRCFDVVRNTAQARKELDIISEYPSISRAKGRLNFVRKHLELCSAFTNIYPSKSACFHYHLKQCRGGCAGEEDPDTYNLRAEDARLHLRNVFDEDFLLFDRGRSHDEASVILVEEGKYQGFGYIDKERSSDLAMAIDSVKRSVTYPDTARIIQRYVSEKGGKMVNLRSGKVVR